MRKNQFDWTYIQPNGKYAKVFKTYMGAFRAASKVHPFDTERMMRKITPDGRTSLVHLEERLEAKSMEGGE